MKTLSIQLAASFGLALLGCVSTALADSASANCEVRKEGETRRGASGPCTFSQRQGYINLDLRNGDSYSLSPTGKEGQYRDQKGNKVFRTVSADTEEFRWEGGKKIILTYARSQDSDGYQPASGAGAVPQAVASLGDLVGADKGRGGYEMQRRGYVYIRTQTSGNNTNEYWQERENGQCVAVDVWDNRYTSISYAQPSDCHKGGAAAGSYRAAPTGGSDAFDTVCGVIVNGQTYRYRCGATDFYSGGRKVRTELRYPDQTIQLAWQSGNRIGLQFEGMVPKEARYSTSEGETNFVFEGKTYFYYSDKGMARMELQNFRD